MALLARFPLTCESVLSAQPQLSRLSSITDVISGEFNAKAARMEPMETDVQVPHLGLERDSVVLVAELAVRQGLLDAAMESKWGCVRPQKGVHVLPMRSSPRLNRDLAKAWPVTKQ
ncbi:hypothetical protein J3458_019085 [Metarhizium acridum]|uniref:uncharacterized protein n=1 Tax=Metarhizium acridum TaxID=92637 RepID=UPI001C6AFA26|nr:hypothetical protein J3458_019085 [Metarhizium acridum]